MGPERELWPVLRFSGNASATTLPQNASLRGLNLRASPNSRRTHIDNELFGRGKTRKRKQMGSI